VDAVTFWRTTDKQEIDFVLRRPEGPLPVEVKSHFPRMIPAVLNRFWQSAASGAVTPCRVIGLYGEPATPEMLFPWQPVI